MMLAGDDHQYASLAPGDELADHVRFFSLESQVTAVIDKETMYLAGRPPLARNTVAFLASAAGSPPRSYRQSWTQGK